MSLRGGPDLVSKLREVIAKVKPLLGKATARPWRTNPNNSLKVQKIWGAKGDVIVKEIHSSNALVIVAAVNAMDELESLLGLEGQAAPPALRVGRHAAGEMHLSAAVFCVECRMYVEIGTDDCPHAIALASPSTPIVPGTAEHGMNCPATNPLNEEDCTCGLRWRIELQTEREMHNAWRKRAEEAEQREARIRKDALREAFLLRPGLPHDGNSAQFREGYYAGLEAYRQAIRSALKEES